MRLLDGGIAALVLDVSGLDAAAAAALEAAVRDALLAEAGVSAVRIARTMSRTARTLIAVGSGKGGVGKSTVAANLAVALGRLGHRVGLVDADIYGPSQPRLLGSENDKPVARDGKLVPVLGPSGVPMLSTGQIARPGQALAWRGPMAGKTLDQLIDAHWGNVEILVIDLPPGTGDVQLTMIQRHKPAGALIVSTPQDLALMDAARAISLFDQAAVPIIGMVENMAGYCCPACGHVSDPFGSGGAEAAAAAMKLDFLGRIPLAIGIRLASDGGTPPAAGDGPDGAPFLAIAQRVSGWLAARG